MLLMQGLEKSLNSANFEDISYSLARSKVMSNESVDSLGQCCTGLEMGFNA